MTGLGLRNAILLIVGNIFIAFLAVKAFGHFVNNRYGDFLTMVLFAIVVVGFVWFPDQTIGILKTLWGGVVGGGTPAAPNAPATP